MDPAQSLILKKPLMEVAHGGGRRLHKGDACLPRPLRLDLRGPAARSRPTLPTWSRSRSFRRSACFTHWARGSNCAINGYFSDGTVRDMTALTVFSSSNESVATVSARRPRRKDRTRRDGHPRAVSRQDVDRLHDLPRRRQGLRLEQSARQQLRRHARASTSSSSCRSFPPTSAATKSSSAARTSTRRAACRIPTNRSRFLNSKRADKRATLVDELVDSADSAEFWTLKWCDILRANSKKLEPAGVRKFHRWVYESVLQRQAARPVRPRAADRPRQRVREPGRQLLARQPRPARRHRNDGPVLPGHPHPVRQVPQPSVRALDAGQLLRHRGRLHPRRPQGRRQRQGRRGRLRRELGRNPAAAHRPDDESRTSCSKATSTSPTTSIAARSSPNGSPTRPTPSSPRRASTASGAT